MNRLRYCISLLLTLYISSGFAAPPNIVILLADDLGSYDVSWRGSRIKTPNLDKLASAGAKLDQFYVQPLCTPTRAALLTGRYPFRYGLQVGVIKPDAKYGLNLNERTLPQMLKKAGYQTYISGKWHLGDYLASYLPTQRGFDFQYGHYLGYINYFTHMRNGILDWHRQDQINYDKGYSTFLIAKEAIRAIKERDKSKPLFLYVPFNAVHSPLQVPKKYSDPYDFFTGQRRIYAGTAAAMDEAVGQITAALQEEGMDENTIIFFASDNGGYKPHVISSNGPLRAGKGTIYEGGVHTCAFIVWPKHIPANSVVNEVMHIVDILPTFLNVAGVKPDADIVLDGKDIMPVVTNGAPSPHKCIIINIAPTEGALRMNNWKLIVRTKPSVAATTDDVKKVELYDLSVDIAETNNVADSHPDIIDKMLAIYFEKAKEAVPPLSNQNDILSFALRELTVKQFYADKCCTHDK